MEQFNYDAITDVTEAPLDCLSLEALFAEMLMEHAGLIGFLTNDEEFNA